MRAFKNCTMSWRIYSEKIENLHLAKISQHLKKNIHNAAQKGNDFAVFQCTHARVHSKGLACIANRFVFADKIITVKKLQKCQSSNCKISNSKSVKFYIKENYDTTNKLEQWSFQKINGMSALSQEVDLATSHNGEFTVYKFVWTVGIHCVQHKRNKNSIFCQSLLPNVPSLTVAYRGAFRTKHRTQRTPLSLPTTKLHSTDNMKVRISSFPEINFHLFRNYIHCALDIRQRTGHEKVLFLALIAQTAKQVVFNNAPPLFS